MKILRPGTAGGPNLPSAVSLLAKASDFPIDAGLGDTVNQTVYAAVRSKRNAVLLTAMNRELAKKQKEYPPAEHPVVRTHPETGRKGLYVNAAFTSHIVGLERAESERLLDLLYRQAAVPEYQCRFRWRPYSIAFWDNRAVQHYASSDYYPQRRTMNRVTICGEPVVGVSGPYTPEEGVAPLPDGHNVQLPAGKRPTREFERHVKEVA